MRLFKRYCTEEEQQSPPPPAGVLIRRVLQNASTADINDLRAALALVAADQWDTESREMNLIELARGRMSWRDIAWSLDLDSAQAAEKRFQRLTRPPAAVIFAFRVDEPGEPWHGRPDVLPDGMYDFGFIDFNPARPGPFRGRTLEVRYGPTEEEVMPGPMRAYMQINNQRVPLSAQIQISLFGG